MADINLLPEELREKEKKELEAAGKQGRASAMKMSQPPVEPPAPAKPAPPAPSLWGRIFTKKHKPVKPKPVPVITPRKARRDPEPSPALTIAPDLLAPSPAAAKASVPSVATGRDTRDVRPWHEARSGLKVEPSQPPVVKARPLPPPPLPPPAPVPVAPSSSGRAQPTKRPFGWFNRRMHEARERTRMPGSGAHRASAEAPSDQTGLDVNLIPEGLINQREQHFQKRLVRSGALVVLTLAVVGLAYGGIVWYQLAVNQRVDDLAAEINQLEGTIAAIQADKEQASSLQQRLSLIRDLLERHQYWTELFALLERRTIDDVYYTNFSMAGTEKVVLAAIGKDYQSVARQIVAFQQVPDVVTAVEVNSALAKLADDGSYQYVNFTINLTLNPAVFARPIR